jgi:hypothetical protein
LYVAEIFLLVMEVGCDVVAYESEEAGYHVGFVAGANELEVDGLLVEE